MPDVTALAADKTDTGKRSRDRDSLFLAATLRVGDRAPIAIRVRNLSRGGLMAEGAPPLAIGTAVTVELRHIGLVPGRIAWFAEDRAGVALDEPIDPRKARKPVSTRSTPIPRAR
jgi:hypothetical protein